MVMSNSSSGSEGYGSLQAPLESSVASMQSSSSSTTTAALRKEKNKTVSAEEKRSALSDVLLRNLWREPLNATSRTRERLGHIDFGMVFPPIRAFFYCALCPYLCYPIALVSAYGFMRCCKTITWPQYNRRDKYAGHVMYAVQKRVYDERRKRLAESQVSDVTEMQHALSVVDGVRHQFVDDPGAKGTAYAVVEQRVMKAEAVFTGENWAWAFISDSCRYLTPIALAYLFHPSCKRLTVDLRLWFQGRLYYKQIRHPFMNFFKTYAEFNQSMQRVNVSKAPTGAQPWSKNL